VTLLSKRFDALENKLEAKGSRILELEQDVGQLKHELADLTEQLDEVRSSNLLGELVLSGENLPAATADENISVVASDLITNALRCTIRPSDICSAFRSGRKLANQAPDRRPIRIRFSRPDLAGDVLRTCKTVKPSGLYVNEWLTPVRARMLTALRHARRSFPETVAACGSHSGRVFVWLKAPGSNGRSSKLFFDSERKFNDFCVKTFDKQPGDLVRRQPAESNH